MKEQNLVGVIIPCYNYGVYLNEAVDSVLKSTYSPIEIIIVNDGSTDNTEEVVREIMTRNDNVSYIYQNNQGPSVARNNGIKRTKAKYILPLDADDKISDDYIEKAVDVLENDTDVKIVYCNALFFGEKQGKWKLTKFSTKELLVRNMIFSCALFRKEDWIKTGGYSHELLGGWEDWEFWISMLKDGGCAFQLKITGFFYRIHPGSRDKSTTKEIELHTENFINHKHRDFILSKIGRSFTVRRPKRLVRMTASFLSIWASLF